MNAADRKAYDRAIDLGALALIGQGGKRANPEASRVCKDMMRRAVALRGGFVGERGEYCKVEIVRDVMAEMVERGTRVFVTELRAALLDSDEVSDDTVDALEDQCSVMLQRVLDHIARAFPPPA